MNWINQQRRADPCQLRPHNIPPRFLNLKLAEIQHAGLRSVVEKYLLNVDEAAGQGIAPLFLGKAGEMKTFAAALIGQRLYERCLVQIEFVQCAARLPQLERQRFNPETQGYLERIAKVPFLIMDDFAQVKPGTWAADFCVEIAERRYGTRQPTLWTANLSITKNDTSQLTNHFGVGFARRVIEGGKGYTVVINN